MRKEIRAVLLAAVLFILVCAGVYAADYTTKAGGQHMKAGSSLYDADNASTGELAAMSSKKDITEIEGTVIEKLPNAVFRVELQDGQQVLAYLSGKLRMNFIRIQIGDKVIIEMPSSGQGKGRIIWRYK